jgi:hypothetical protein
MKGGKQYRCDGIIGENLEDESRPFEKRVNEISHSIVEALKKFDATGKFKGTLLRVQGCWSYGSVTQRPQCEFSIEVGGTDQPEACFAMVHRRPFVPAVGVYKPVAAPDGGSRTQRLMYEAGDSLSSVR